MGWKSVLARWFMTTKQEATCEESQEKGLRILDLRQHDVENCKDFSRLLSPEYMEGLRGLLLQRNDLKEFSNGLPHYLPELKYLTLDYNKLTDLPFDMRNMRKLTVLNVSHNSFVGLHFFHVVCQLKSLKILWANGAGIREIPKEIKELRKLRTLGLRGNQIEFLPAELFTLPNLRWLTLSSNEIREIPDGVENLKRVVHLNLNHNRLTELPTTLIYMQELQYLFIKHNFIRITEEVLDFVRNIPNLKCCAIRGNLPTLDRQSMNGTDEITMPSNLRQRRGRGLQSPVSSEGENIWYSESETQEPSESIPSEMEMVREYYESSGSAPEALSEDLETVYRYDRQSVNGSLDVSTSLEYQVLPDAHGSNEKIESECLDPERIGIEVPSNYGKLESDPRASRIQEWLIKQNHQESGNGNILSSLTPILPSDSENGKDDLPVIPSKTQDIDVDSRNFLLKDQVDCFIEDAVEMVTNSVERTPNARPSNLYFLPYARDSISSTPKGPSTSATFHSRRSTSSVMITPSTLFQVRSQAMMENYGSSDGIRSPPQHEETEEGYEQELEERDDHNVQQMNTEPQVILDSRPTQNVSLEPGRVLTPTASEMFPNPPFEIDTTYDPSDWEHSSPSSAIDDQDIAARFSEFTDVYLADDLNNNNERLDLDEDGLRFLIPLMYLT